MNPGGRTNEITCCSIQTMSCKLLLNLVECIRARSEEEKGQGRELLMRMLEVFVLKFKTIAKLQLPVLMSKWYVQDSSIKLLATCWMDRV